MCMATLTMQGATLTNEQIRNAWRANPDGGGIAYFDANGNVQAFRTLSLAKFERGYARLVAQGANESPMAIHFRLATHGDSTVANVHPFRMDEHTMVIHNGILPIDATDSRSDTCIFVTETLPKLGALWFDDAHMWNLVDNYCANGYPNKLVVLTSNPDARGRAYIVNKDAGHWNKDKTIWFSNRSYECATKTTRSWNANSWVHYANEDWNANATHEETDEWERCYMCDEPGVAYLDETGTNVCYLCGTCQGCSFEMDECACGETPTLRTHEQTENQFALFHMR